MTNDTDVRTVPDAVVRLATLVREVCDMPQFRGVGTYATYIAELAAQHDEAAKHPRGTAENREEYAKATTLYHAARKFAARNGMPDPNSCLRSLGYAV